MFDRLKTLLGGASPGKASSAGIASRRHVEGPPFTRPSNGLDQFFTSIRDRSGLRLLDFAGASQSNISFITSLGHGISSADFTRAAELAFGDDQFFENQTNPQIADEFLRENLNFPPEHFDGALAWDSLQFLTPHLLQITVDRLYETLRPDSYLLAFFHANEKLREVPVYNYRIQDQKTLQLTQRALRPQAQFFNNRALEKLFHRYHSVKFFLTRDNLREIIVRR
ncbi:MAG TPA: class I SAM-dependent methyltransferase [Bryobacteraceae bacterium]|nr:class I SAM-dependent methyltransferase [Bryobacteraceae bacterium]